MANVNLIFDPIRQDEGVQLIQDNFVVQSGTTSSSKLYFGSIVPTSVVYVNGSNLPNNTVALYWGSTKIWGTVTPTLPGVPAKLSGVTYTASSTYSSNSPPTYQYMNDGNANGSTNGNQWGSNSAAGSYIVADLGSTKTITSIVIGYDYLSNLPGGWGVTYTEGLSVDTSPDNSTWTTQTTTPTYSSTGSTNGLVTININNVSARYIRLYKASTAYIATLEFQVWGY